MGISPFSNLAIESMRSSGYAFTDALCELLDNSIWHGQAKNIQIDLSWLDKKTSTERSRLKEVFVVDDGIGMTEEQLSSSVRIGESTTYGSSENFGRFGYGLIAGALTQCRLITIYSKTKKGKWYCIEYDVNEIAGGKDIPHPIQKKPLEKYTSIIKESGTIIIWSIFDLAEPFDDDWEAYSASGTKKGDLGYLYYELGRIYRKIIGKEIVSNKGDKVIIIKNENIVNIILNGKKIIPVDPLYLLKIPGFENDPPPHHVYDALDLSIETHPSDKKRAGKDKDVIHIRMTLLNEKWRKLDEKGNNPLVKELHKRYIQWNEGISVLRNGREVSFEHNVPRVIPSPGTWDRFWGCEIDFPSTLDKRFTIKNVKVGIKCDKELEKLLKSKLSGPIRDAVREIRNLYKQSTAEAIKIADKGPHDAAEETFKRTNTGTQVGTTTLTPEEKEKVQQELVERFRKFDSSVDKDKFSEIGVIFQDDVNMYENGPFLEVRNNLGNNIVIYNLRHPFFIHLDGIYKKLESLSDLEKIENLLGRELTEDESKIRTEWKKQVANTRYLIDLLLGSFAASKGELNSDAKQLVGSTLNSLISRWTDNLFTVTNDKNFEERVSDEI